MPGTRVGVMGGTFDPIHFGHLAAASEAAHQCELAEVVFVPTGDPWQKAGTAVSPAELRYQLTVVATADDPRFTVSRVDIEREGSTYTVDTLRDLRAARPDDELFFITGADALAGFSGWREPAEILTLAHLIGVDRPGHHLDVSHLPAGSVTVIDIPDLEISSTLCRERVERGEPIRYLVPDSVERLIAKAGLYRGGQ
ncbi:MAG: nicotinate-nucleotide adenylyltransferase [Candidatus Nanopelagicales bacterium]